MALVERLTPTTVDRPWGTEQTIVRTADYSGKILRYKAGHGGGLQYHVLKDETWHVLSGRCYLICDRGDGVLERLVMKPGDTYRFPPFSVHQVIARSNCVGIEFSTPHEDDRVRVEKQWGVPGLRIHRWAVPVVEGAGPTTWDVDATGYHTRRAVE